MLLISGWQDFYDNRQKNDQKFCSGCMFSCGWTLLHQISVPDLATTRTDGVYRFVSGPIDVVRLAEIAPLTTVTVFLFVLCVFCLARLCLLRAFVQRQT